MPRYFIAVLSETHSPIEFYCDSLEVAIEKSRAVCPCDVKKIIIKDMLLNWIKSLEV